MLSILGMAFGEEKRKRRNKVFMPLKFNVDSFST